MIFLLIALLVAVQIDNPRVHAFASFAQEGRRRSLGTTSHERIETVWRLRCSSSILSEDLALERCCYPFDQAIHGFYRSNFHKKRNKRQVPSLPKPDEDCSKDSIYVLKSSEGMVVAALRLTRSKNNSAYTFLRSLCVFRDFRRHGLALRLVNESLDDFSSPMGYCYCFASPYLESLYEQAGFLRIRVPKNNMDPWPKWLIQSYNTMDARWSRKTLGLFIKSPPAPHLNKNDKNATQIVLLQHSLEFSKKTATGWLLDDRLYSKGAIATSQGQSMQLSPYLNIHRWVWSGRDDTARVEAQIRALLGSSRVYLLWTGGSNDDAALAELNKTQLSNANESDLRAAFIVLDGTWQQAKTLFRKIPGLWKLSRVSLSNVPPSNYVLRGDYSGLKERFSGNNANHDAQALLCTAEVAAAILDLERNHAGACIIRTRLEDFQKSFFQQRDGTIILSSSLL